MRLCSEGNCTNEARPRGRLCWAHVKRKQRAKGLSAKRVAAAIREKPIGSYGSRWARLREAALAYALSRDLVTYDRLRKAAIAYARRYA